MERAADAPLPTMWWQSAAGDHHDALGSLDERDLQLLEVRPHGLTLQRIADDVEHAGDRFPRGVVAVWKQLLGERWDLVTRRFGLSHAARLQHEACPHAPSNRR